MKESIRPILLNQKILTSTRKQEKRVEWNEKYQQPSKFYNNFERNNQYQKRKISVSSMKKLKDFKTPQGSQKIYQLKPSTQQHILQHNQIINCRIVKTSNKDIIQNNQFKFVFPQKAYQHHKPNEIHQIYKTSSIQLNQFNFNYHANQYKTPSLYDIKKQQDNFTPRSYIPLSQKPYHQPQKTSPKKIIFSNKNINSQYFNPQQYTNLSPSPCEIKTSYSVPQIQINQSENEMISSKQKAKIIFRKTESIGSFGFSEQDNSIVLQHFPFEKKKSQIQQQFNQFRKKLSFNKKKPNKISGY